MGAGSNGEGSDLAPSLGPSNRVQGTRKRLSSDCEPSLPDHTHSRAPGLRRNTPRDAASKEAKRGALGAKGHLRHPRRVNRTSRSSAGRANEIGLLFRSVDPSLLEDRSQGTPPSRLPKWPSVYAECLLPLETPKLGTVPPLGMRIGFPPLNWDSPWSRTTFIRMSTHRYANT